MTQLFDDKVQASLEVVGGGSISIDLETVPKSVVVEFSDHPSPIPCNPHHDTVSHRVHEHLSADHKLTAKLVIRWNVVGTRKITWVITY